MSPYSDLSLSLLIEAVVAANIAALNEVAQKVTKDLISQHRIVSPEQAAELHAWFALDLGD